ncbi:MHC class I polypeptide-related sequence B [Tupaia chinensis]|uniref:MHC class I polypeptide-related sequence B n=1 Tax=Tupaia chinensis TaxID=246437 RepID=L9KYQ2_TUPCH|nr:MHC class I polypeptide-related sequence B [Tupaia chinensis]
MQVVQGSSPLGLVVLGMEEPAACSSRGGCSPRDGAFCKYALTSCNSIKTAIEKRSEKESTRLDPQRMRRADPRERVAEVLRAQRAGQFLQLLGASWDLPKLDGDAHPKFEERHIHIPGASFDIDQCSVPKSSYDHVLPRSAHLPEYRPPGVFASRMWCPGTPAAPAGPHTLQYTLTVGSQDGSVQPRFLAEGHLDSQPFLHYDSENGRAEPRGPWAEAVLGAETRDAENELLTDKGKDLRMSLAVAAGAQRSTRGFRDFRYDGEPLLSYDPKTQRWTVPWPSAQALAASLQRSWEDGAAEARKHYRYTLADCVGELKRYLRSRMGFQRPAVTVTHSEPSGGTVNLTCWAFGFYPWNISLAWHQDGQPLSQDAQWSGGVLPYENGTYQAWVVTRVPQGEEPQFTCHVGHGGNHSTHPVPGKAVDLQSGRSHATIGAAVAVAVAVFSGAVAVVLYFCWCRRKHGAPETHPCPGEHSELMSVHIQDPQQTVNTGPEGTGQPGVRSLLQPLEPQAEDE